jgi:tRNA pseudouridine32 synthase/23S rRNA pseudouridine746 synthase/23S rRNA pseudouridine1911/1915/1917 synthase
MVVDPAGQRAITEYRVRGADEGWSWLELRPHTGRTHQLRVHCAELGCPVIGDPVYGKGATEKPMLLHARGIVLPLYPARAPLEIAAPVPSHMAAALARLGHEEVPTA